MIYCFDLLVLFPFLTSFLYPFSPPSSFLTSFLYPFSPPSSFLLPHNTRGRTLEDTIGDKDVERQLVKVSASEFKAKTTDGLLLGREVGNMYCASLYGGLASLFAT